VRPIAATSILTGSLTGALPRNRLEHQHSTRQAGIPCQRRDVSSEPELEPRICNRRAQQSLPKWSYKLSNTGTRLVTRAAINKSLKNFPLGKLYKENSVHQGLHKHSVVNPLPLTPLSVCGLLRTAAIDGFSRSCLKRKKVLSTPLVETKNRCWWNGPTSLVTQLQSMVLCETCPSGKVCAFSWCLIVVALHDHVSSHRPLLQTNIDSALSGLAR
jgi:hypothetical protein